ncbi:MAG: lipid-A-disaccharide synthase [Rickettsiales bacterium]|jgi:lipid-A-disaccharide synthase|nr:lipid-A-disaccharide synthase [Rickettsiales bacterium]
MPEKKLKIFIIAGEVSGDVLGAKIMRAMPGVQWAGIGGVEMRASGLKSLFPISDLSVMGFWEVIMRAKTLTQRINDAAAAIIKFQPDIVLTIDAPSFAIRVVKKVKLATLTPTFYHVVAPQVWAWGAHRAKKYAAVFDRLYSFFDFEKPFFTKYGLETIAVGHPIADGLHPSAAKHEKNIALMPGSRISEVKRLLPIFRQVVARCSLRAARFYIPTTETTDSFIRNEIKDWPIQPTLIPFKNRYDLFARTDMAIAASGTISVELAIMHVPAIVVYKMNPITTWIARRIVKLKWVSLVNILMNKTIYPELLGGDCTAENIIKTMRGLDAKKMITDLRRADSIWHKSKPAAEIIAKDILKV